jgi:hypothetical protein
MMASIKQRIENQKQEVSASFNGYALVCRWEYEGATSSDGLAAYVSANGPIPDDKQLVVMGWAS